MIKVHHGNHITWSKGKLGKHIRCDEGTCKSCWGITDGIKVYQRGNISNGNGEAHQDKRNDARWGNTSDAVIYKRKVGMKAQRGDKQDKRMCIISNKCSNVFPFTSMHNIIMLEWWGQFERQQNFSVHYAFIIHSFLLAAVGDFVQEDELLGEVETDKVQQK